jgi:hypothetical protein
MLRVPAGMIDGVFIVNPTLHELAGHAPQLPRLRSLGLFPAGEFPWSVFINDLRVISETAGNAAIFLHYLVWRARIPLGERITVNDELDLWGSYLLCERFGTLAGDGHQIVGNSSTDFDAYYAGVVGEGPKRPMPRKFLTDPLTGFIDELAQQRPRDGGKQLARASTSLFPSLRSWLGRREAYGSARTRPTCQRLGSVVGSV